VVLISTGSFSQGAAVVIVVFPHHVGKLIPSLLVTMSAGIAVPLILGAYFDEATKAFDARALAHSWTTDAISVVSVTPSSFGVRASEGYTDAEPPKSAGSDSGQRF
jgi:hypothetical protein